jgi:hypothetical protein
MVAFTGTAVRKSGEGIGMRAKEDNVGSSATIGTTISFKMLIIGDLYDEIYPETLQD